MVTTTMLENLQVGEKLIISDYTRKRKEFDFKYFIGDEVELNDFDDLSKTARVTVPNKIRKQINNTYPEFIRYEIRYELLSII